MKNLNKALLATIILPLTLGSASALAFGGGKHMNDDFDGQRMEKSMFKKGQKDGQRGMFNKRLFGQLDLTSEQKDEIQNILQENRGKNRGDRGERKGDMSDTRQEMRDLTLTDKMDEAAVRALAEKIVIEKANDQADMIVARAEIENKIYNVLTAEQKVKFKQLQKEQKQKQMERMKARLEKMQKRMEK